MTTKTNLATLVKHCTLIVSAFFFITSSQAFAKTYNAHSSKHPVALIELYTSQGCSSCPPAEKWLGELEQSGVNSNQAIPLALHVDYWDYIGWEDQFSQKYFTQRQYQYRKTNHSESVYTPQIMFNGNDVRGVNFGSSLSDLKQKNATVAYKVTAETVSKNNVKVAIDFERIDAIAKNSNVVVVLAESDLVGDIKTGENAGRTLKHNHVVRVWKNMGKIRNKLNLNIPLNSQWEKDNLDLIVIVETQEMQTQQALKLALK